MQVSVDGLRRNLAHDYNELVRTLRQLVEDEDIQDASVWGDAFGEIEEKLQAIRESVGLLLLIYSDDGEFKQLDDEIDRLEHAIITKQENEEDE